MKKEQSCLDPWVPTTNRKMIFVFVMCNALNLLNSTNRVMCIVHDVIFPPNIFHDLSLSLHHKSIN